MMNMSMTKRHLEDIAYKYLESHPGLGIEDVMEKIVEGEITDAENELSLSSSPMQDLL